MATENPLIAAEPSRGLSGRRRSPAPTPIQTRLPSDPLARVKRPPPVESVIYKSSPEERPALEPGLSRRASRSFLGMFGRKQSPAELRTQAGASTAPTKKPISPVKEIVQAPSTPKEGTRGSGSDTAPKTKSDSPPQRMTNWDPPPLFQAYPQCIKHSTLLAPTIPAATVLRNRQKAEEARKSSITTEEDPNEAKPAVVRKSRQGSTAGRVDCVSKIYALVTSGCLLQYSATGAHDRRPERVLRLGRSSAAFASDAIPGRHWVLQVNQASADDGTAAASDSSGRNVFARLALRGSGRRYVSTLLLVMPSAEEMDAWLVAIRRQIQSLGGQAYAPDVKVQWAPGDAAQKLQSRPSRRFVIKRDLPDSPLEKSSDAQSQRTATMTSVLQMPTEAVAPALGRIPEAPTAAPAAPSVASVDSDALRRHPTPDLTHGSTATASTARSSLISTAPSKRLSRIEPSSNLPRASKQSDVAPSPVDSIPMPKSNRPLSFPAAHARPDTAASPAPNFSVPFTNNRFSQTFKAGAVALPTSASEASSRNNSVADAAHESSRTPRPATMAIDSFRSPPPAAPATLPYIPPVTPTRPDHPNRLSSLDHAYGLLPWSGAEEPSHADADNEVDADADVEPEPEPEPKTTKASKKRHSAYAISGDQPPPQAPLPALPPSADTSAATQSQPHPHRVPALAPLPPSRAFAPSFANPRKLRRPASMQVRTDGPAVPGAIPPRLPAVRSSMALRPGSAPYSDEGKQRAGVKWVNDGRRADGKRRLAERASVQGYPLTPPPQAPLPEIPGGVAVA